MITTIMIVLLNCNLQCSVTISLIQYLIGLSIISHVFACLTALPTSQSSTLSPRTTGGKNAHIHRVGSDTPPGLLEVNPSKLLPLPEDELIASKLRLPACRRLPYAFMHSTFSKRLKALRLLCKRRTVKLEPRALSISQGAPERKPSVTTKTSYSLADRASKTAELYLQVSVLASTDRRISQQRR